MTFNHLSKWKSCVLTVLFSLLVASAHAVNATLEWDANTEPDLAGYRLHFGYASGAYETTLDVGNTTRSTLSGFVEGTAYYFVVTAYNADGLESSPSNEVMFTSSAAPNPPAPNQLPVVSLDSPTQGLILSAPATVNLSASASDPDGSIARVEYFAGEMHIATAVVSPFTAQWVGAPSGTYSILAVAYDDRGGFALSAPVDIRVNAPPEISLTTSATQIKSGGNLTLTVTASDQDGSVKRVEFYSSSALLGKDMNAPYKFTMNRMRPGTHVLTAVAYDDFGAATSSAPVTVYVR